MPLDLTTSQWVFAILGAIFVGISKSGLPGSAILTVAIYALIFDPKESVGILLPVLIFANTGAIIVHRRNAHWRTIVKILPPMLVGIFFGYLCMDVISSEFFKPLIGSLLLSMTALYFYREWRKPKDPLLAELTVTLHPALPVVLGVLAGFSTMIANAAGPLTVIYLMSLRLPMMLFIGTNAWLYFIINFLKGGFQYSVGIITTDTLQLSLILGCIAFSSTFVVPLFLKYIPQKQFNRLIWFFVIIASLKLLY